MSDEEVDLKPLREATIAVPTPKISEKRKAEEADASKDLKKAKLETKALKRRGQDSRTSGTTRRAITWRMG